MSRQNDNRVLSRRGARELNEEEIQKIEGGIGTTTICTIANHIHPNGDGDPGECI